MSEVYIVTFEDVTARQGVRDWEEVQEWTENPFEHTMTVCGFLFEQDEEALVICQGQLTDGRLLNPMRIPQKNIITVEVVNG